MKKQRWTALGFCLAVAVPANALDNNFPIAKFYPEPIAILYPGMSVAAGVNAASLAFMPSATAMQVGLSPGQQGDEARFFTSVAHTGNKFGAGLGWEGLNYASGMSHNGFIGVGRSFGKFGIGLALREYDMNNGFTPSLDFSLVTQIKSVDVGFVFYNMEGVVRMAGAVGTRSGSKYNLEASVLLPPFSNLAAGYVVTFSAQIAVQPLGIHFRTSYDTFTTAFSHTLGLAFKVRKSVTLAMQFSTPRRVGGAVTVTF